MKIQGVKYVTVILCLIFVSGCTLAGSGYRLSDGSPVQQNRKRSVNAYYLFSEAHLSLKRGNVDRAIEIMQQAQALDPDSVYLRRELANLWLMKKNTTAAIELLDDILAGHPDDVETLILAGRIHHNLENHQKAIEAYSRVIELDPSQENVYLMLGGMYMDQERWDDAVARDRAAALSFFQNVRIVST